jgi:hypothetical protein
MTQRTKYQLARTQTDYIALLASDADFIARTKDDLKALRQSGQGPLSKPSETDFTAFIDSLEFKDGGVAHGKYKSLMSALTVTEILEVFAYMGMDKTYAIHTLDYGCSGESCGLNDGSFCSQCLPQ